MASTALIKNLDNLLQPFLGKDIRIVEFNTKPLTAAGENYGSLMLKVEIKLQSNNGTKQDIKHLVAKLCPPNEFIKKMFNIPVTFKKEVAIYKTVVPALKAFQQVQGVSRVVSFFPECYGARISLQPPFDVVDDDAVLLLENLQLSGYKVVDRMKGFDLETARLIMKDLATFHAVPIAMKLLQPDVFKSEVLPHLDKLQVFDSLSAELEKSLFEGILDVAKVDPKCVPLLPVVEKALQLGLSNMKDRPVPREPFATINHNDFWVNNTMIKFVDGKPVHNKMVDFQLVDYGSPANDILFFIFSSLPKHVIDQHYDDLLKLYYDSFINTLKDLKCDTKPFSFQLLQDEIEICAKSLQFFHVMVMLRPIFAKKGTVKELEKFSEDDMMAEETISDEYRQKVPEIICHFAKRKWI